MHCHCAARRRVPHPLPQIMAYISAVSKAGQSVQAKSEFQALTLPEEQFDRPQRDARDVGDEQ
jgi:hypothetical protein